MTNKTVLIIRNAAKNDFGGAETYPVSLARLIKDEGWTAKIVTKSQKLATYAAANDVEVIRGVWTSCQNWSGVRVLLFPLYALWQCYTTLWYLALIRKERPSVLHIQSRDDFIAASIAGRLAKIQVVWTDHMDLRYVFMNIAKPLKNPVGKLAFWAARFTNHIILISNNEYSLVTSHFKNPNALKDKIVIVKNGVVDRYKDYPRLKPESEQFTFCLASRVVKNKGIGETIKAFGSLDTNDREVQLHIYGDGADLSLFKDQARKNPRIFFHGHVEDALQPMSASNAYILPSYQEGFSIALLEATMLGKAIIATDVDSNPEIITDGENGLLVSARNSKALAIAMKTLLDNPELVGLYGQAARLRYEKEFNLQQKVRNEILPLYER